MYFALSASVAMFVLLFGSEALARVEHSTVDVYLDPQKNALVTVMRSRCFIMMLTPSEIHETESARGREDLMIMMLKDVIGFAQEHLIYHTDIGLTDNMQHWCGTRDIFLLMRNNPTQKTTTASKQTSISASSTSKPTTITTPTLIRTQSTMTSSQTTTELPTRTTTSTNPTILYDNTLSLKAVIVTNSACFVYRLTEIDRNLINIGTNGKLYFEQALLGKDRSSNGLADLSGNIGYMTEDIRNACNGVVYLLQ